MFKKSMELHIAYDDIYRKAREVSRYCFKWTLFFIGIAFGLIGGIETNPDANIKAASIMCVILLALAGVSVYFGNKYQNMSEEYKEKAEKEYVELLKLLNV